MNDRNGNATFPRDEREDRQWKIKQGKCTWFLNYLYIFLLNDNREWRSGAELNKTQED